MCKICPVRIAAWPLLAVIALPLTAFSAEVLDSSVTQLDDRYLLHVEAMVQAHVVKVRELIKNHKNFPRLSRSGACCSSCPTSSMRDASEMSGKKALPDELEAQNASSQGVDSTLAEWINPTIE